MRAIAKSLVGRRKTKTVSFSSLGVVVNEFQVLSTTTDHDNTTNNDDTVDPEKAAGVPAKTLSSLGSSNSGTGSSTMMPMLFMLLLLTGAISWLVSLTYHAIYPPIYLKLTLTVETKGDGTPAVPVATEAEPSSKSTTTVSSPSSVTKDFHHDSTAGSCMCHPTTNQVHCIPKYHVIGVHKAGSKALMTYMKYHSGGLQATRFIEDPTYWLTNTMGKTLTRQCQEENLKLNGIDNRNATAAAAATTTTSSTPTHQLQPVWIPKKNKPKDEARGIMTCSFHDYTLLYGQHSNGTCPSSASSSEEESTNGPVGLNKPMFDELVIWEKSYHTIDGNLLPAHLKSIQPTGNILITVRSSVDVAYSAYNHFGIFKDSKNMRAGGYSSTTKKGPQHFDILFRTLINVWRNNGCTIENFRTCLPSDLVLPGSWLSRSIYSQYVKIWLEQYTCSQTFIFDVSEDPYTEVNKLYDFVGVPDREVAKQATASIYELQKKEKPSTSTTSSSSSSRHLLVDDWSNSTDGSSSTGSRNNPMNKNTYEPMMESTRQVLNEFYEPHYKEICDMMSQYPCLKVPLFMKHCG